MPKNLFLFILVLLLAACDGKKTTDTVEQPTTAQKTDTAQTLPALPAPDSSLMILPGKRVGQIRIGETSEKITATLGKPDSGDAAMGKALSIWLSKSQKTEPRRMVAIFFSRNNNDGPDNLFARQIRINSPAFKTPEAIHTGTALGQIREKYTVAPLGYYLNKQQQRVYIFDDRAQGIAFEITTPDSTCTAITIHEKGEDVANTYIPLYPDLVRINE